MKTCMTRALLFASLFLAVGVTDAFATHGRYGTIRWRPQVDVVGGVPVVRPNVIIFTVNTAWRRSFFGSPGIGSTIFPGNFCFGDGICQGMLSTVTALSTTEDWVEVTWTVTHTYPAVSRRWTASHNNCCRISSLEDGNNDRQFNYRTDVVIDMASGNSSPAAGTLPIINVAHNVAATTFSLAASDPDNDALAFAIAPTSRSGLVKAAPDGLTINGQTGVVTWDTRPVFGAASAQLNGLYAVQFLVTDTKKAVIPVDVLLRPVAQTTQPPTMLIDGSKAPATFTVPVGTPLGFVATGTDPDIDPGSGKANRFVTLTASGVPVGASLVPSLPVTLRSPASSTFSWIPGPGDVGNHTLTFGVTDDASQQDTNNVTIIVPQFNRAPTLTCPSPVTVDFGTDASVSVDVEDADGDGLTVAWTVDGVVVQTDNVPGSSGVTTVTLTRDFGAVGLHSVSVTVTDTANASAKCKTTVTVVKADQTIDFTLIPDHVFGDPPFPIFATATSGLPVSFSLISGPVGLVGDVVTITGTGVVTIRAAQGGDADYNPAPPVDQAFTITKATPTVTVPDVTVIYDGLAHPATGTVTGVGGVDLGPLSFTYDGSTTAPTDVGVYAVVGSYGGSANYTAATGTATLTITPKAATVTAGGGTKVYGTTDPALSATTQTGFLAGDVPGIVLASTRAPGEDVGAYVTAATATGGNVANYTVTYFAGNFSITPKAATVTAGGGTKVYGTTDPALSATTQTGFLAGDVPGIVLASTRAPT